MNPADAILCNLYGNSPKIEHFLLKFMKHHSKIIYKTFYAKIGCLGDEALRILTVFIKNPQKLSIFLIIILIFTISSFCPPSEAEFFLFSLFSSFNLTFPILQWNFWGIFSLPPLPNTLYIYM